MLILTQPDRRLGDRLFIEEHLFNTIYRMYLSLIGAAPRLNAQAIFSLTSDLFFARAIDNNNQSMEEVEDVLKESATGSLRVNGKKQK